MGNYDVSDNNISLCVERIDRRIFFLKRRGIRSPQSEQTKGVIRNTYLPFHRVPCPSRDPRHRTVCYQFMGKNEIFPAPQETQAVLEFNRDFEHAFFFLPQQIKRTKLTWCLYMFYAGLSVCAHVSFNLFQSFVTYKQVLSH